MNKLLRYVFLALVYAITLQNSALAQDLTLQSKKNLQLEQLSIQSSIIQLQQIYGIRIIHPNINLSTYKQLVTLQRDSVPLHDALEIVLSATDLYYRLVEDYIELTKKDNLTHGSHQIVQRQLSGTVKNTDGQALSGVSISTAENIVIGATDEKGHFAVSIATDVKHLIFRNIGFLPMEHEVTSNSSPLAITLEKDMHQLEEVVINTGYQKIPKERATGAFEVIDHKQIENKIQTNVLERLEGIAPGLLIMNGVDNGGEDAITLRGVSTLAGTKRPLIVVDNFPITGDISSINPRDVESITLLKDAAAASIWGAQSSNGVIVITTKRPQQGKLQYSYSSSFQFQPKPNLGYLNRLSSAEDIAINLRSVSPDLETFAANGRELSGAEVLYLDRLRNVITEEQYQQGLSNLGGLDNRQQIQDLLMQNPFTMDQTFALSGGGEHSMFYGSVRNMNQRGYALRDNQKTTTIYLKSILDLTSKLKLNVNANLNFSNGSNPPVDPAAVYQYKPYEMLADVDGNPLAVNSSGDPINNQNTSNEYSIAQRVGWGLGDESYYPLNEIYLTDDLTRSATQRVQAELSYQIVKGLTASLFYQYESGYNLNSVYTSPSQSALAKMINDYTVPIRDDNEAVVTNTDGTLLTPTYMIPQGGRFRETRGDARSYSIRPVISYNKTFNAKNDLSLMLGGERSAQITSSTLSTKYGYDPNTLQYTLIDANILATQGAQEALAEVNNLYDERGDNRFSYVENRYIAAFFNGAYTYKQRYTFSASSRMDQTNLFGSAPASRYRPNWSVGFAWLATSENFLKNTIFDQLKFRGTYGVNGNINRNSGPFMIATASQNRFTQLPSYSITSPANPALGWEATYVTNIGVDYSLLRGRFAGKVDFYDRDSRNVLATESINPTLGFSEATLNVGGVNNRGVEVALSTQNIMHPNFKWRTSLNYSYNRNVITYLEPTQNQSEARDRAGIGNLQGYPYQSLWSFQFAGLSETGQPQVYDADGGINAGTVMMTDVNALVYSGSIRPASTGAMSNFFSYKNFDLSVMFVWYGDFFNRRTAPLGGLGVNAYSAELAGAWRQPGDEATTIIPNVVPDPNVPYFFANAYYLDYLDAYAFNASYIKLREVILTYNVSPDLLKRTHFFRRAQVNFQARNLWTYAVNDLGIDPEAFSSGMRTMPVSPTYAVGINLEF